MKEKGGYTCIEGSYLIWINWWTLLMEANRETQQEPLRAPSFRFNVLYTSTPFQMEDTCRRNMIDTLVFHTARIET